MDQQNTPSDASTTSTPTRPRWTVQELDTVELAMRHHHHEATPGLVLELVAGLREAQGRAMGDVEDERLRLVALVEQLSNERNAEAERAGKVRAELEGKLAQAADRISELEQAYRSRAALTDRLGADLDARDARIKELEGKLAAAGAPADEYADQVTALQEEVEAYGRELDKRNARISELNRELAEIRAKPHVDSAYIDQVNHELDKRAERIAELGRELMEVRADKGDAGIAFEIASGQRDPDMQSRSRLVAAVSRLRDTIAKQRDVCDERYTAIMKLERELDAARKRLKEADDLAEVELAAAQRVAGIAAIMTSDLEGLARLAKASAESARARSTARKATGR
jgi:chromosome segregation ATPase